MKSRSAETELRPTDTLLMLGVVAGLVFAMLLQTVPEPSLLVDAVWAGTEPLLNRLFQVLVIGLLLLVELLVELLP